MTEPTTRLPSPLDDGGLPRTIRLALESDGTVHGTRVIDSETGARVLNITELTLNIDAGTMRCTVHLHALHVQADLGTLIRSSWESAT